MKAKRFISILLFITIIVSTLPLNIFAEITPEGSLSEFNESNNNINNTKASNSFEDVKADDWFYEDVEFVNLKKLMNGTGSEPSVFSPYMPVSRAMLVTVLYRLEGNPDTSDLANIFIDVPDNNWYSSPIKWAGSKEIVKGVGEYRFALNDNVTREQAAALFLRYAQFIGKSSDKELVGDTDFVDKADISDWAVEGSRWCNLTGIIKGKSGKIFDPKNDITRAEISAMLHRFTEYISADVAEEELVINKKEDKKDNNSSSGNYVKVSFETNGGNKINPVSVTKGDKLIDVPVPIKDDSLFTGWYMDEVLTNEFYSDSPITESITIYASYVDRDYNYKEFVEPVKLISDCSSTVSFEIFSKKSLNESNFSEYLQIRNTGDDSKILDIDVTSQGNNIYSISSVNPYTPGYKYEISLFNKEIYFSNEKEEVRTLVFTILKKEIYEVEIQDAVVYLTWDQVEKDENEEGVYSISGDVFRDNKINEDSTICLTNEIIDGQGILNSDSKIRNVIKIIEVPNSVPQRMVLLTEASSSDDIYENVDIYVKNDMNSNNLENSFDLARLEQDLKESENTFRFTRLLALAINESDTVSSLMGSFSGFSEPVENNDKFNITVNALQSGLTVHASIGSARNNNFTGAADNNWVVLTVDFDYNAKIKDLSIDANFVFKEYFTIDLSSYVNKTGLKISNFDIHVDAYSQTDIEFTILVKTSENDGFLDITKEIDNLIKNLTTDNSVAPTMLKEVLGNRGDYITLAEIDLYEYKHNIENPFPVLEVKLDINFVVRINLALGLNAKATLLSARRIGVEGSETNGFFQKYDYALDGHNRQSFELVCAGYLGVKAGINVDLSVYFTGLEKLGKVGVSGEVGAYMDLWGFLRLNLIKAHTNLKPEVSMNGGMLMEIGIYVEIKLYAVSETFNAKAELYLLDRKFPLYTLGDRYVVYRFNNAGKRIIMHTNDYDAKDFLDLEILDLKTGEVVGGDYTQLNDFSLEISNPWFMKNKYDNIIHVVPSRFGHELKGVFVPEGTQKLSTKIRIHYDGGSLTFNTDSFNELELIWVDPSVNLEEVDIDKVRIATYVTKLEGVMTQVAIKQLPSGEVPGSVDLSEWLKYTQITGYENDFNTAIWKDTTYVVNLEPLQILASYIYWNNDQWHYELHAAEKGDTLPVPRNYRTTGGMEFKRWNCSNYWIDFSSSDVGNMVLGPDIIDFHKDLGFVYTEYNTSGPIEHTSGTLNECIEEFIKNDGSKDKKALFHSVGEYIQQEVNITYNYPEIQFYIYGDEVHIYEKQFESSVWYGKKPIPDPFTPQYPYCTKLGWDEDNDGIEDYAYNDLPIAKEDAVYSLVVEPLGEYKVIHTTEYGVFSNGEKTVEFRGNYEESQEYIQNFSESLKSVSISGITYNFIGWREYVEAKSTRFEAIWTSTNKEHTVIFDSGDGMFPDGAGGTESITKQYSNNEPLYFSNITQPIKDSDEYYTYRLTSWKDQDGKNYSLTETPLIEKDMTFTAVYTAKDSEYTVIHTTEYGVFSNGEKTIEFTGNYAQAQSYIQNFSESLEPVSINGTTYTFRNWTKYVEVHSTRFEAVWSISSEQYNVIFDSGEGIFTVGTEDLETIDKLYSYNETVDFSSIIQPVKAPDNYNTYTLTGWEDQDENIYELDEMPVIQKAMTFTALYTPTVIKYTITFDSNGGYFGDDITSTSITQTYNYGDIISPPDSPTKVQDESFSYEFNGWNPSLSAGTTVTGDQTYEAAYTSTEIGYTITFDSNGGYFGDDITVTTLTQTYNYGDTISPPADPNKVQDENYTYEFNGWNPSLSVGTTVTDDQTYTATYSKFLIGVETGIIVTDGTNTEDISVGTIEGYSYEVITYEDYNGVVISQVPTLTVRGDGLTFSGTSDKVVVVIDSQVSNVTFENLSIKYNGEEEAKADVLVISESNNSLDVNIKGDCIFNNEIEYESAIRIERRINFIGEESAPSLSIEAASYAVIYNTEDLTFDNLNLTINAKDVAEEGYDVSAIFADAIETFELDFIDSEVKITSDDSGIMGLEFMDILIQNSDFDMNCETEAGSIGGLIVDNSTVDIKAEIGLDLISEAVFTGDSSIVIDVTTGPAIKATAGITVDSGYDLGELSVKQFTDDDSNAYYTFAALSGEDWIPVSYVKIPAN